MKHFYDIFASRKQELLQLKTLVEKALTHAPDGFLRINRRGKRVQYYHRTDPQDSCGSYICQSEFHLAKKLAQKDYNTKILHSIEQELKALERYNSTFPQIPVEEIYDHMTKDRQAIVTPYFESDIQYINNWSAVQYQGKDFGENIPELYTSKGERVRSKSEIIIADSLARANIPYRYEFPLTLSRFGKVYPDFTVLNINLRKEMYWEHLGMMDDQVYVEHAIQKIATYAYNGIFPGDKLILTYETRQIPINQKLIHLLIQKYLL